jgi:stearoyl-CoA 9-desaturase NADPH oxidoreductase
MSMLRSLDRDEELGDVTHVHSARSADRVIFAEHLDRLARRHAGYRLHLQLTGAAGRVSPTDLDRLCPDWRERQVFASGPRELLDGLTEHWRAEGDPDRLAMERFQPMTDAPVDAGQGGRIAFTRSGVAAQSDGATPILVAGEAAGAELPFGCRMGICHTCIGRLCSGEVRDLRTGEVHGVEGEMVRTCVNAPEGPVEIAL